MESQFDPLLFCGPEDEAAQREALIARTAYARAEHRGFKPGHAVDDWLAAEKEVCDLIAGSQPHESKLS
jgi:hypothetical protein